MQFIPLTQSQVAMVDNADYKELSKHKWYARKDHSGVFYAVRKSFAGKGNQTMIHMHRQILGLEKGDRHEGDHINHNTLDNCRSNLRICTHSQNQMNQKSSSNTTSRFKGVCWNKQKKKWQAGIKITGKLKYLGLFELEEEAAQVYDEMAILEHGEYACLNFELELI